MTDVRIGTRRIGGDQPPFIIAEVGINHEGDVEKALQCVDAAVAAGADCVKFQCHITEAEMISTDMKPGRISEERLWDIIKRCELTEEEERRIKAHCEAKDVLYLCTPFSREAADRLERMGVVAYKIGSGECNNTPLVEHIARKDRPIILSTGMSTLDQVDHAIEILGIDDLVILQCTASYPSRPEELNLRVIKTYRARYNCVVGYSGHEIECQPTLAAVALGACYIERHITVDRSMWGSDQVSSLEPEEFKRLVRDVRIIEASMGDGVKRVYESERPAMIRLRGAV